MSNDSYLFLAVGVILGALLVYCGYLLHQYNQKDRGQ